MSILNFRKNKIKFRKVSKLRKLRRKKKSLVPEVLVPEVNIANFANITYDPSIEQCLIMKTFLGYVRGADYMESAVERSNPARRICKLLNHTYYIQNNQQQLPEKAILGWTYALFSNRTDLIITYIEFQKSILRHKSATILNFCNMALEPYFKWFTLVRQNCSNKLVINSYQTSRFTETLSIIRRAARLNMKRKKFKKTKQFRIEQRNLPSIDQIKLLHKVVRDQKTWANEIKMNPQYINEVTFTDFLQVMFSSIWLSPQESS